MAQNGLLDTIAETYMRNVGNPARQLLGGGVRGLLGFDPPEYADSLGMEAYRNAAAMGNAPGINAPVGAFKAAAKVVPEAAMFIGALAKTWDKASNAKALQMEKAGKDARDIWRETGNLKGPDGKWRQEISDDAAKLRDYSYTPQEAFKKSMFDAAIGDGSHTQALAMRPYSGMTKNQLTGEYARTGGEIVDAAMAGDKAKAMQLNADRAGLTDLLSAMRDRPYGPVSAYMRHGELNQAYPDVYKMHTRITDEISPSRGAYLKGDIGIGEQIQLANRPRFSDGKSTMLHELQHAIQQREGFARGGSERAAADVAADMIADKQKRIRDIQNTPEFAQAHALSEKMGWDAIEGRIPFAQYEKTLGDHPGHPLLQEWGKLQEWMRTKPTSGHDAYRRLAGEAEARATQTRMGMTPAERRATFPYDSYDVPVDQLIVRGLLAP